MNCCVTTGDIVFYSLALYLVILLGYGAYVSTTIRRLVIWQLGRCLNEESIGALSYGREAVWIAAEDQCSVGRVEQFVWGMCG